MPIRKRKCENCEREAAIKSEREHPTGWRRTGHSRYGREFDRVGIAWWCPDCGNVLDNASSIIDLPQPVIQALGIKVKDSQESMPDLKHLAFQIANDLLNQGMVADNIHAYTLEAAILEILERNFGRKS